VLLPCSLFFPYTTLFRSLAGICDVLVCQCLCPLLRFTDVRVVLFEPSTCHYEVIAHLADGPFVLVRRLFVKSTDPCCPSGIDRRSEEHTSELQSQSNLVC